MVKKMQIKKGIPVSPGYKVRKALLLEDEEYLIGKRFLPDPSLVNQEIARFEEAVQSSKEEIEALKKEASLYLSKESLQIFSVHQMLLSDPKIYESVVRKIKNHKCTAEYAVSRTMKGMIRKVKSLPNDFFASRVKDLVDVEKRLLRNLSGKKDGELHSINEEVVIIAKDLTPSQTATLDRNNVVGFATDSGGKTSHTAIVARALGIPAVVGLENLTQQVENEDLVVIDGVRGYVIVNPDEKTLEKYKRLETEYDAYGKRLRIELKDLPCETRDGYEIHLWANIEVPEDIEIAVQNGAEGIGLYRTEFLYARTKEIPSEEIHFQAYRKAVDQLEGKPIVIRLLDLGADKFYDRIKHGSEKNPFLGCRSIRYLFHNFDILKAQLRAILRVSPFGDVRILLPMISTVEEVRKAKEILHDTMESLERKNIEFNPNIPLGIMLEVPSSVVIADILAKEVDFFSIGTNDLVQYTLAVDRINERVADLYQPAHPAILRMLKKVIDIGKKEGITVSICGEMSGEVKYILPLIGLGLTNLSLTPKMIPQVKKVIRSTTLWEARKIAQEVFDFDEPVVTEKFLEDKASALVPDLFHKN
ncbi:MAG: phosphoenolpyruvate--protein phosphotransferase [Planctomycetota bacterium]|nr:MAG: phosphoenolpyruvate--protein phosphotransferase [Planctomycetota bacterium]